MQQQQMIELIQQHHPNMGETEIILGLNRAKNDFEFKTELIKSTFTQLSDAGKRYYTLDQKIVKIIGVQVNDVDIPRLIGKPIIDDDEFDGETGLIAASSSSNERYWYVDNGRLGVVEKGSVARDGKTSSYQSISEDDLELRIHCIALEPDFADDMAAESELPSQFHDALVYKVIAEGYLKAGSASFEPKVSQIFEGKYNALVKDGKKQARNNYMSAVGMIRPQEF